MPRLLSLLLAAQAAYLAWRRVRPSRPPYAPEPPDECRYTEDDVDDTLGDSFPASDPPSMTQPKTTSGAPDGKKSSDTGTEAELARQLEAKKK